MFTFKQFCQNHQYKISSVTNFQLDYLNTKRHRHVSMYIEDFKMFYYKLCDIISKSCEPGNTEGGKMCVRQEKNAFLQNVKVCSS